MRVISLHLSLGTVSLTVKLKLPTGFKNASIFGAEKLSFLLIIG